MEIQLTADGVEVNATMSPASAAALLKTAEPISTATFAAKRADFTKAAPRVCALIDVAGEIIPPARTVASLNTEGEVCILFQYPATTNPNRVRAEFLATLSSGYFVGLTDRRFSPARHGVLFHNRETHSFIKAATGAEPAKITPEQIPIPLPTSPLPPRP